MEKIQLGIWYVDDMEDNANKIVIVSHQIKNVTKTLENRSAISRMGLYILMSNIIEVLSNWTGNTYVGHDKELILKNAFQIFFNLCMRFFCNIV